MRVDVHNAGFVEYVDHMGSDARVANVARVSFNKWADEEVTSAADRRLVRYLLEHEHTSPFRHCYVTLRVKAPIFVLRQWGKHQVGCAWNEVSMRYVDVPEEEFFVPQVLRAQAKVSKQGSTGEVEDQERALGWYEFACDTALRAYRNLLDDGVCREQARCVLPQAMYTEVIWTASLQAILHFLRLRLDSHAQVEIQDYAKAVLAICKDLFNATLEAAGVAAFESEETQ